MGIVDGIKNLFNISSSKRRSRLGVEVAKWDEEQSYYYRTALVKKTGGTLPDKFVRDVADDLEGGWLKRNDVFALQRNGKKALAMRNQRMNCSIALLSFSISAVSPVLTASTMQCSM